MGVSNLTIPNVYWTDGNSAGAGKAVDPRSSTTGGSAGIVKSRVNSYPVVRAKNKDLDWVWGHYAELLYKYDGLWIAVLNEDVVGYNADAGLMMRDVHSRGIRRPLILKITKPDDDNV